MMRKIATKKIPNIIFINTKRDIMIWQMIIENCNLGLDSQFENLKIIKTQIDYLNNLMFR